MFPELREAFHARHGTEAGISGEDFVSSQAGQRDFHSCPSRFPRDEVGIDPVHGGQVHRAQRVRNRGQNVRLRNIDFVMIGMKLGGDGTRVLRFRKIGFPENDGERAGSHAATAENADQRARIDASGKKHSHWHVAD